MIVILFGTTHELVEQLLPDERDCAGDTDQDIELAPGGRNAIDLDKVVSVDVGGWISCNC
ncbi:MAG: hypothetical protein K2H46_00435 [Muribaculaceae bacterium]|nr:hypothetical protein [Muribaculaceae bacterium]